MFVFEFLCSFTYCKLAHRDIRFHLFDGNHLLAGDILYTFILRFSVCLRRTWGVTFLMDLDKINQLKSQAQTSSDFLVTKVQQLTDSFTKINQKTAKHALAMSNAQKCLEYLDLLLDSLKTASKEEKLITRGVGTDVQPFLDSLNRIQNAIKILSENPWKGSEKNIVSLRQLRKVGLLQLNNLFLTKIRQVSEPLDIPSFIRNGVDDPTIIDDEALEFIQKLAATIHDGSTDISEFSKEFITIRSKFIYESLVPLGSDAFSKRGAISTDAKSPSTSGFLDQFSVFMEWTAILLHHERKFSDTVFRMADKVHTVFESIISTTFDIITAAMDLALKDLKEFRKQKQLANFFHFLESMRSIQADFRMMITSLDGLNDKQQQLLSYEQQFLSTCAQWFDLKAPEIKPQPDGTIHEQVHFIITFVRKLLEHNTFLPEWIESFAQHEQPAEYIQSLLSDALQLIDDTLKYFQHDLHRRVYALNNINYIINITKDNVTLAEYLSDATLKYIQKQFHHHFDGYIQCWSIIEKSIEETRKTLDEKAFKDKSKSIYTSFEDVQKLHKSVHFIDQPLQSLVKVAVKDRLTSEYNLLVNRFSLFI